MIASSIYRDKIKYLLFLFAFSMISFEVGAQRFIDNISGGFRIIKSPEILFSKNYIKNDDTDLTSSGQLSFECDLSIQKTLSRRIQFEFGLLYKRSLYSLLATYDQSYMVAINWAEESYSSELKNYVIINELGSLIYLNYDLFEKESFSINMGAGVEFRYPVRAFSTGNLYYESYHVFAFSGSVNNNNSINILPGIQTRLEKKINNRLNFYLHIKYQPALHEIFDTEFFELYTTETKNGNFKIRNGGVGIGIGARLKI